MWITKLSLPRFFVLWLLPFAVLGSVAWLYPSEHLDLFPSEKATLTLVSDSIYGGNSKGNMVQTNSLAAIEYELDDERTWPLMMMRIKRPGAWHTECYNELHLDIKTEPLQRFPIFLTAENHPWPDGRRGKVRMRNSCRTEAGKTLYVMPLDEFEVDGFWYKSNRVAEPLDDREVLLAVDGFFMETSETEQPGAKGSLEIRSIRLVSNPKPVLWLIFYILSAIQLLLLIGYLIYRKYRIRLVVVPYEQRQTTRIQDKEFARIQEFLAHNYEKELNAKAIWQETGIPRDRVARIVKDHTGQTLRGYLNTLRLAEAKRLLVETDLAANDIAYRVGYGTSAHFHRVFKETERVTPMEYRANNQ